MLLQTNSYIVPKDKRTEHARLVKRFRQVMSRLGCDDFEVYEQSGPNWSSEVGGRFVQIMRFRDREHARSIREKEQQDPVAQELVREFCEIINFPYQYQNGLSTTAFYSGVVSGQPTYRLAGGGRPTGLPAEPALLVEPTNGQHTPESADGQAAEGDQPSLTGGFDQVDAASVTPGDAEPDPDPDGPARRRAR